MNCLRNLCRYLMFCCPNKEEGLNETTFYDNIDPFLVYTNNSLGTIEEGASLTITGYTLFNCERFSINLLLDNPTKDIALHINPRLPQNYIVRNCKVKNFWGAEEVSSALPFILKRGSKFTIQILITESEYLISINGHHFAGFRHRLPYNRVKCLEVKGDVENIEFDRTFVNNYPNRIPETRPKEILVSTDSPESLSPKINSELVLNNFDSTTESLQLPYYGILPSKFNSGQRLRIDGRVKILPHSFFVNLQSTQNIWPHPIVAFHFNPRFATEGKNGKHVICKNAWYNGEWDKEERSEMTTDFVPGRQFSLSICTTDSSYEVYLNEKFIADFQYRVDTNQVDSVYIQGDIKLWNVILDRNFKITENMKSNKEDAY